MTATRLCCAIEQKSVSTLAAGEASVSAQRCCRSQPGVALITINGHTNASSSVRLVWMICKIQRRECHFCTESPVRLDAIVAMARLRVPDRNGPSRVLSILAHWPRTP